jgi:hypothetical protein
MNKRLEQSLHVMREMYDLGFPTDYPPLKELSRRLSDYVKTGEPWSGKIKFEAYKRVAEVILPRRPDRDISVNLKHLL